MASAGLLPKVGTSVATTLNSSAVGMSYNNNDRNNTF